MALVTLGLLVALSPFPLDAGQWWEYRETYTEVIRDVAVSSEQQTRVSVTLTPGGPYLTQTGGVAPAPGLVESGEGWIRLPPWTGEDVLPLPLEVGVGGGQISGFEQWRVEAAEDVIVPAGRFRALRCTIRGPRTLSVLWIAPGVGVVRETSGRPGEVPDLERALLAYGTAIAAE